MSTHHHPSVTSLIRTEDVLYHSLLVKYLFSMYQRNKESEYVQLARKKGLSFLEHTRGIQQLRFLDKHVHQ